MKQKLTSDSTQSNGLDRFYIDFSFDGSSLKKSLAQVVNNSVRDQETPLLFLLIVIEFKNIGAEQNFF